MLHYPIDHPYFDDDHPEMLDEVTYKDILHVIDPRDLPHRDYARLIPYVKFVGIEGSVLKFYVPSPTALNEWNTYIQFTQWNSEVRDTNINANEAARLLMWTGDIRVHCGCPSFLFWGYQYILTQMDAAIWSETIYPRIRNPQLKGIVCKHLRRTIKVLPFHLGDMAKEIKQQRTHF